MLEDLLKREDVLSLIHELKSNERYFDKKRDNFINFEMFVSKELALYIFYEALIKYQIILNDIYLFDEYLKQIEKLYKRIDNFNDITMGINKVICKMVSIKFGIEDVNDRLARKEIISYIYNKYIVDGYYVHGFNTSYEHDIKHEGLVPEFYENYYQKFITLNNIFAKNGIEDVIGKDFSANTIIFTDDIMLGCYYSIYAPMFFSRFLANEKIFGKLIQQDGYLIDDYDIAISNLKRFMNNSTFSDSDKKFVLQLVKDEWDLLHREDKKISLMFVKRRRIDSRIHVSLDYYIDNNDDVYSVVDRLLSSKNSNVVLSDSLSNNDIVIVSLDSYYDCKEDNYKLRITDEEKIGFLDENNNYNLLNSYGKVSLLILLGSLLITLGVIFTIFMILGGI